MGHHVLRLNPWIAIALLRPGTRPRLRSRLRLCAVPTHARPLARSLLRVDDSFLGRVDVGLSVGKIKGHYVCGGGRMEGREKERVLEERAVLIREVLYDTAVEKGRR